MAQLTEPPPVHSFDLDQPPADTAADPDETVMDFYREATEIPLENAPLPSPPPGPDPVPPPGPEPLADYAPPPVSPDSPPAPDPVVPPGPGPAASQPPSNSPGLQGQVSEEASAGGSPGRWIQLEIGQTDGSRQAPVPARPTTAPTVPLPPSAAGRAPGSGGPTENNGREAGAEALNQAMDQAIQQPPAGPRLLEPDGRETLRHLFSDMLPPESQSARALSGAGAQGVPPPAETAAPEGPEDGSSAILKAGGLLTLESQFGAAEILPPLTGKVDWQTPAAPPGERRPAAKAEAAAPSVRAEKAKIPAKAAAEKPAGKAAAKSSGQGRPSAKKTGRPAAKAPPRSSLIVINETGRGDIGRRYGQVLGQMGYQVVSVADREPGGGPRGQTVINYRPGQRAQAQAMARHLPGKKVLREVRDAGSSQIMIYIR